MYKIKADDSPKKKKQKIVNIRTSNENKIEFNQAHNKKDLDE